MENDYVELKANIHNFEIWLPIINPEILKTKLDFILDKAGFTIVNFIEHNFTKEGYTCIWLLAESHLAVHTFPNENKSYIQLSSCNLEKKNVFQNLITQI